MSATVNFWFRNRAASKKQFPIRHPEWFYRLRNNSTVNIVRYANGAGRKGSFNLRQLLNGGFDRYLYPAGLVATSLPFEELRRKSRINAAAGAADDDPDCSVQIRESLPGGSPKGGARW